MAAGFPLDTPCSDARTTWDDTAALSPPHLLGFSSPGGTSRDAHPVSHPSGEEQSMDLTLHELGLRVRFWGKGQMGGADRPSCAPLGGEAAASQGAEAPS